MNLVKIFVYQDSKSVHRYKVQFIKFKNKTAKDVLLNICPELREKLKSARVYYNYYEIDIPEAYILVPNPTDEIAIHIKTIKDPVWMSIIKNKDEREIGHKVFQKREIYYRTPKEIVQMVLDASEFNTFEGIVDKVHTLKEAEYYKNGTQLKIIVGDGREEQIPNILNPEATMNKADQTFLSFKRQLREIFRDNNQQDTHLSNALAIYVRSNLANLD